MSEVIEYKDSDENFLPSRRNWFSFISLLVMQTMNAFNDKAVQFLMVCTASALLTKNDLKTMFTSHMEYILAALIVTPFILLSPLAGWIGDRVSKSTIIRFSTFFQLFVFLLLVGAILLQSLLLMVFSFFLLAIQSAILSPSKIGVIKELVGKRKLGYASGLLEMFTILGILGGTIIMSHWYGARLSSGHDAWGALSLPIFVLVACTPFAILFAFLVQPTKAKDSRPFKISLLYEHFHQVGSLLKRRNLRLSSLAVTYFWIFGGFIQLLSVQIAKENSAAVDVGLGPDMANMMLVAGGGIAFGSVLASIICKKGIELGLVPVGGAIMAGSCVAMAMCEMLTGSFMTWLFISGLGAAFFLVPVNAYLQDACDESERGNVLAANNLLNCFGGILAVGVQAVLSKLFGFTPELQFLILGALTVFATLYATRLLPQQSVRFMMLMLVRVIYRIRIEKDSNMPKEGGVLLVPNHASYLDAFIISAASPRPVRFLMFDEYFKKGWMVWFLKLFNTVPISRTKAKQAISTAAEAVAAGDVVCIFPEGQLTRTGMVNEVRRGFEMIARKANCPVLPVYMDGLWGSIFSFERGKFIKKWPYKLQYGVTVVFAKVIDPPAANHKIVRNSLTSLSGEAFTLRDSVEKAEKFAQRTVDVIEGDESIVEEAATCFRKASLLEKRKWMVNALQIADGPAILRGSVLAMEDTVIKNNPELFGFALPIVHKLKLVVIDSTSTAAELKSLANKLEIATWLVSEELAESLKSAGVKGTIYQLREDITEPIEGYSLQLHKGKVISINMPDPGKFTTSQEHQAGAKPGSFGRLLAGFSHSEEAVIDPFGQEILALDSMSIDSLGFISPESGKHK